MNKGEVKRLGDYIREVDVRNRDLEVTKLLGVSISKEFMPSIANTIGTDMSSYKVVEPRQFAYGPVTSRNGDKVSIALYKDDEKAIVSQAYTIFEVKNKQELLPEYLMMWFRRSEFDRYARFKSHGSAREIFSWEEMCENSSKRLYPNTKLLPVAFALMSKSSLSWKKRRKLFIAKCLWTGLIRRICREDGEWGHWGKLRILPMEKCLIRLQKAIFPYLVVMESLDIPTFLCIKNSLLL